MYTYDRTSPAPELKPVLAADPEPSVDENDTDFGELQIAEYIVFLLAVDTYMRYLDESSGGDADPDEVATKGLRLLRMADRLHLEAIGNFFRENLPSDLHKRMLEKALRMRPTPDGASRRALQIRTLLSRGGAPTMRAVFQTNKALQAVRTAISASMVDNADTALDKFAVIQIRNVRLRDWIDDAAKFAGSGVPPTPVAAASQTSDDSRDLVSERMKQQATSATSQAGSDSAVKQDVILEKVQQDAQETAKKSIENSGEEDTPPKKSEVVGIATAAAVAAMSDPADLRNVPDALRKLDPEQRGAALTDGRVLVAAGAGSGKSTTLVSRIRYLVQEKNVHPSRILATSFNQKAGKELGNKVAKQVGAEMQRQMTIGTMHSTFRRLISQYGSPSEKIAMGAGENAPNGFISKGTPVVSLIPKIWKDCFGKEEPVPSAKKMGLYKAKWAGNGVTPEQAKAEAEASGNPEMITAAIWYEWYEGAKGAIPDWKPPCKSGEYVAFLARKRPGGIRLGDFDDMLGIARDILRRNPAVRKDLQRKYDHVMVDECQDLNLVQFDIIQMMTEHIQDGDGKSLWMVGDASQSIYGFRGADVSLFVGLDGKPGWTTRKIKTNYRCAPKIVTAANALVAHNETGMMIEQRAVAGKLDDSGSITVMTSSSHKDGAVDMIDGIKQKIVHDDETPSDFAVLCRTNNEIHAYETACVIRGVPYARKGASSFLGSPETKAMLSYVQMVTGDDFKKMQAALKECLKRPNRFFAPHEQIDKAVDDAFGAYASRKGLNRTNLNPLQLLSNREFCEVLANAIKPGKPMFVKKLMELGQDLSVMKAESGSEDYKTEDLFRDILNLKGTDLRQKADGGVEFVEVTFQETLQETQKLKTGEDDEDETEEVEDETPTGDERKMDLGNIGFLYELIKPDPTEPGLDASTPAGFKAKMERYAGKARELRTDVDAWMKAQDNLPPDQRQPPPGVYLGTVHSVKGAEWKNCAVVMPRGTFPMVTALNRARKEKRQPTPEEVAQAAEEMESERRLAYVALTRAAENLTVICPQTSAAGKAAGISPFVYEAGLPASPGVGKIMTADVYDRTGSENPATAEEVVEPTPFFDNPVF